MNTNELTARTRPKRVFVVAPSDGRSIIVEPGDVVTIDLAEAVIGLTRSAMEMKIHRGQWVEGRQYHRDPQGCIWIDRKGVRKWVVGE